MYKSVQKCVLQLVFFLVGVCVSVIIRSPTYFADEAVRECVYDVFEIVFTCIVREYM